MAFKEDWIPRKESDFDGFFKNYCQIVTKNTSGQSPAWTHIPSAAITELNTAYADWYTAWSKLKQPHTSADVLAKDEAEKAGKKALREFNREFILNSRFVTDAQRKEIGCPVHDTTPTPGPRPKNQPVADITYPGAHLIELDHIRSVTGGTDDCCPALPDSLGVFAWQKLQALFVWSFGYAETPKLSASGG
jgi:hypothetical protein